MKSNVIWFGLIWLMLSACGGTVEPSRNVSLMLEFQDSEPGIDPYVTRILINRNFMRMDDGIDNSDYTLYDRVNKKVYTVSLEEERILELKIPVDTTKIERKLIMDAERILDKNMPSVGGKSVKQFQLLVNDRSCTNIIAAKGLLPEAVKALSEFRRTMVNIHLSNLKKTPPEFREECFLAHDIRAPFRTLQFGFPIFAHHANGQKRVLVNFTEAFNVADKIYVLPEGYERVKR